jgi:two-component system, OmpR family, sensor kinase
MKLFKSIKWRLQIWYGLILVVVLAGFGFTAYQLERNEKFNRLDIEMQRRFGAIVDAVHPHSHPPGRGRPPYDRPPPDGMPDDLPPLGNLNPGRDGFHLSAQSEDLFDPTDPHDFFYIVHGRDGDELERSTNTPAWVPDRALGDGVLISGNWLARVLTRSLPSGEVISVGGSFAPEMQTLNATAIKLAGIGTVILFFGLAGGWWISSRAMRPVEDISAAAVKISAGDLTQRISVTEVESELGRLASVLNSTFERLESAFAQQKQFAADAAHELRTPVSVILTQTQSALNREREAKDYKQTIEACQRAAQRMRKLISALLELARLDAGQEPIKHLPCDLSKMISVCVELVRPLAEQRGIKLNAEISPMEITGDAEKLAVVVTNLLTNAIDYNHDGGEVRVNVRRDGNMAVLNVSDTGRGIPPEDLPRVFERFYRADKSRSSSNAGLGLAISRAIIAAHGGSIDVASEDHAGAVFTIRLPA